jgi:hypothetical protein
VKPFEYNGEWWLPETPDHHVAGIVRFDPSSGCTLEIVGNLRFLASLFDEQNIKTILGRTSEAIVTLYNCRVLSFSFGESNHQNYLVGAIFVGIHATPDELKFYKLLVRYAQFEKWLAVSGIQPNIKFKENGQKAGTINFEEINVLETSVNDLEIKIRTRLAYEEKPDTKLSEQAVIDLFSMNPLNLDEWGKKFIFPFEDFLSFVLNAPTYPMEVTFTVDESTERGLIHIKYRQILEFTVWWICEKK